ncbi:hypothetical protein K432DRAFT_99245 [Lepidopterella palustris CBS 459.81]|uniref:Uncharacterized protein n=1 Tax=Lepidopterella palustris CBS 459.81 TaxID=1314670 RepID=A0A8E2E6A9_9PEZI|nr:hypothetical protein K432DRAFT_99245 [Lepidopterella palustris CBS 459.81]
MSPKLRLTNRHSPRVLTLPCKHYTIHTQSRSSSCKMCSSCSNHRPCLCWRQTEYKTYSRHSLRLCGQHYAKRCSIPRNTVRGTSNRRPSMAPAVPKPKGESINATSFGTYIIIKIYIPSHATLNSPYASHTEIRS